MTIKEVIAELETIFPQYAEAGLIDRISLSRNMITALRKFGNNIMIKSEHFADVTKGRASLPKDFWNLLVAVKCEPINYNIKKGSKETLLDSYFFRERTEERNIWNYTLDEHIPEDTTTIRETFKFKRAEVDFNYKLNAPLKLVKGFKKDRCAKNSPYKNSEFARQSPYEINILNNHLQTNFPEGTIYMQYLALPSNDDGDIIIPDTQHDELRQYILYYGQRQILERVLMSDDDLNVGNKLQYALQMERHHEKNAYTETKMESLRGWKEEFIKRKRIQTLYYDRLLPNK